MEPKLARLNPGESGSSRFGKAVINQDEEEETEDDEEDQEGQQDEGRKERADRPVANFFVYFW